MNACVCGIYASIDSDHKHTYKSPYILFSRTTFLNFISPYSGIPVLVNIFPLLQLLLRGVQSRCFPWCMQVMIATNNKGEQYFEAESPDEGFWVVQSHRVLSNVDVWWFLLFQQNICGFCYISHRTEDHKWKVVAIGFSFRRLRLPKQGFLWCLLKLALLYLPGFYVWACTRVVSNPASQSQYKSKGFGKVDT